MVQPMHPGWHAWWCLRPDHWLVSAWIRLRSTAKLALEKTNRKWAHKFQYGCEKAPLRLTIKNDGRQETQTKKMYMEENIHMYQYITVCARCCLAPCTVKHGINTPVFNSYCGQNC